MHDQIAQLERENFRLRILLAGQRDPNVFAIAQTVVGGNFTKEELLGPPPVCPHCKIPIRQEGAAPNAYNRYCTACSTDWSEWQDDWCNHNRMVATGDIKHAWKCQDCGYIFGKGRAKAAQS